MPEVRLDLTVPKDLPRALPVLPLRRGVLLPGGLMTLSVGRPQSLAALRAVPGDVLVVAAQREPVADPSPSDLLPSAVLARVIERREQDDGTVTALVQGLARAELTGFTATRPFMEATWRRVLDRWPDATDAAALVRAFRDTVRETARELGEEPRLVALVTHVESPPLLVDAVASTLETPDAWKREILSTHDPVIRLERVLEAVVQAREIGAAHKAVKERIQEDTRDMQREFFLRRQLDAIKKELGEDGDDDELTRLRERLGEAALPDEVREVVDRELRRLERIGEGSPERSVAIDWLEWVADMPWDTHTAVDPDLDALESALDRSHHGLDDVKRQVIEHLAVRKFAGSGRADVLLLVGPPGVGKTSIGQAIADATGRKLVRVALGGVRDEAELRGHRRTYIGARPGRLVEGVRRAGTSDPVVLLDEIDKLGQGNWGDPAAALLEVLDPEQNHAFVDRYLEVPFDLSRVLFVATANDLSAVPGPLRDRMHVLDIEGYTLEEKRVIAREHLLPTVAQNAGMAPDAVSFDDDMLRLAISGWTREAGVRELQRVLGRAFRQAAVRKARGELTAPLVVTPDNAEELLGRRRFFDDEVEGAVSRPGVATGLAWTPVGGDVLYVEASTFRGTGRLVLTGQLGDVMKESARAALTYALSNAESLGIDPDAVRDRDVHLHVPAGAVPKDGPSAGVTMFTALASLLTGRPVRADTAMTGEATLRGRVLPVGGIKSKVLAAHRNGFQRVVLPRRNGRDLEDVPAEVLDALEIVLVDHMDDVLDNTLEPTPARVRDAA